MKLFVRVCVRLALASMAGCWLAAVQAQGVWQFVDRDGVTHMGNVPPPQASRGVIWLEGVGGAVAVGQSRPGRTQPAKLPGYAAAQPLLEEAARAQALEPALVIAVAAAESGFNADAVSRKGALGLMQVMPATARWTARKIGLDFTQDMLTDRDVNLRLGTSYLKLVLDDFGGSQAMAAAAYNAGPSRPRRWREGAPLEAAAWAENIPFNETRDYVKKVLHNATVYAAVTGASAPSLKTRLGARIGPRDASAPASDTTLP